MVISKEERKTKKKEYSARYNARPEVIAKRKEYYARSEVKARLKEYNARPEVKAKIKEYEARHEVQERKKEYRSSPERKAKMKEYNISSKVKKDNVKMEVYLHYSKIHSNSDIPCCRCCGLNSHIEFLSLDHISQEEKRWILNLN